MIDPLSFILGAGIVICIWLAPDYFQPYRNYLFQKWKEKEQSAG